MSEKPFEDDSIKVLFYSILIRLVWLNLFILFIVSYLIITAAIFSQQEAKIFEAGKYHILKPFSLIYCHFNKQSICAINWPGSEYTDYAEIRLRTGSPLTLSS